MQSLQSALGVVAIIALAWAISENRRAVPWRPVIVGLILTFALAALFLKLPQVSIAFDWINKAVISLADATKAGTAFVFGYIGGGPLPFELKNPGNEFVLGFQALPVVLVISVLSSLLFYWRIMPPIVRGFSWALEKTLDVGGAAGLSTAASTFVGHVEAPLFIRPYLASLSRSEMFIVMTGGMARIAGTVFVLYATILGPLYPGRRRPHHGVLVARRTGRDLHQPFDGARPGGETYRRQTRRSRRARQFHHGCDRQRHRRRTGAPPQHRRHADRVRGAGLSGQRRSSACCPTFSAHR